MIKCKNGVVTIKGDGAHILAEFSAISKGMLVTLVDEGLSRESAESHIAGAVLKSLTERENDNGKRSEKIS